MELVAPQDLMVLLETMELVAPQDLMELVEPREHQEPLVPLEYQRVLVGRVFII